ncbi:MAG: hypothetical protein CL535_16245 [Ahrensia sp.]|nr:hypothetical protein [Ahrensia sp.]MBV48224.1 hypothetical protein [Roseobacter sp.]|tara:strand:- start:105680 stop:106141 length:462 start_codon:yes stop_codon:yes gene_type:complete
MTHIITTWLVIFALLASAAWLTVWSRRDTVGRLIGALSLPLAAAIALMAVYVPLGDPLPRMPADGEYSVIGARIVPGEAIYVLMSVGGDEPVYYRIPYDEKTAKEMQEGMYDRPEGSPEMPLTIEGGEITIGGEGNNAAELEAKRPEAVVIGG